MVIRHGLVAGLSIALLHALPGVGAEVVSLPPVVVRGRMVAPVAHLQGGTRLDARQIRESGAVDLAGLVPRLGSLAYRQYGVFGQLGSLSARGAGSEGVLVLRDGIRLNSPVLGSADLSTVSLVGVEKVEWRPGLASALFGSSAMGGVLSLISGTDPVSRISVQGGSFGLGGVDLQTGGRWGDDTTGRLAYRRMTSQGNHGYRYRDTDRLRSNADASDQELSLSAIRTWEAGRLETSLGGVWLERGVPGPIYQVSSTARQEDVDVWGRLAWQQVWDGGLEQRVAASWRAASLHFRDPASSLLRDQRVAVDVQDVQAEWGPEDAFHAWRLGLGVTREVAREGVAGSPSRQAWSLVARDRFEPLSGLALELDGRLQAIAAQGGLAGGLAPCPRAAVTWTPRPDLALRSQVGRAFRNPTFNDLFWPTTPDSAGNPALRPETADGVDLGFDWAPFREARLSCTLAWQAGHDTIAWQPGAGGRWSPVNLGETRTWTVETRAEVPLGDWLALSASGTWLDPRDAGTTGATAGKVLPFRPGLQGRLALRVPARGPSFVELSEDWVGARFSTAQNTEEMPPVALTGLVAGLDLGAHDRMFARVDNLFDQAFAWQPYYPMPGRLLRIGWDRTF